MNIWKEIGTISTLASAIVLGGCATAGAEQSETADYTSPATTVEQSATRDDARVASLQSELDARQARITDLQSQLASQGESTNTELFPPQAQPGQCYARILTEEKYRTSEERVLVREESEAVEIMPARFEDTQERVLVKEESTRIEIIPAEYETVSEQILVKAASKRIIEIPTTFRTETEEVLDKPAYTVWKRGAANTFADPVLSQNVNATGEVMCLVEVPATYKTITRSVVDVPARTEEIEVPAEYKTVQKLVVKRPATTREVTIPAEYETVSVRQLVEAADERRTPIPAEYRTVTKTEKISDAELDWQQVLCDVNATRANVVALQEALRDEGYTVGPIDGVLGSATISAVSRYAAQRGIPHGANYVPVEVLKALDLDI